MIPALSTFHIVRFTYMYFIRKLCVVNEIYFLNVLGKKNSSAYSLGIWGCVQTLMNFQWFFFHWFKKQFKKIHTGNWIDLGKPVFEKIKEKYLRKLSSFCLKYFHVQFACWSEYFDTVHTRNFCLGISFEVWMRKTVLQFTIHTTKTAFTGEKTRDCRKNAILCINLIVYRMLHRMMLVVKCLFILFNSIFWLKRFVLEHLMKIC